jgi:asparagine synthase (glutamine-hydrolysing)
MCGICGVVLSDRARPVDRGALDRMTDAIAHRGPDDRGLETWDNIGFGNRRLAIIDKPGGHQPMSSPGGQTWITYNGELYNYLELRSELLQAGYPLRSHSDTEVLLGLYEVHGLGMFERMNGMFAFAIHDLRQRRVVLARDRFGEKPLYWLRNADGFLFASEIKSLLQAPGVRATPDPAALQEYLTFQYCLGERTLFAGVRKLPPSSYLVVDDTGETVEQREYWSLGFEEDHGKPEQVFMDELGFLLEDAVKIRLRSDVPVGTYLSGGVDSSLVTSLAARLLDRPLPAFTGYFGESEEFSELEHARAAAAEIGSEHHAIEIGADDFAANFRRLIYHLDEPAAGPGAFPQLMVSQLASEHVKVVLGGQGGDEIFGGYARYLIMYLEESIKGSIYESQDPSRHLVTLTGAGPNLALLQKYVPLLQRFWSRGLFEDMERRYFALVNRDAQLAEHFSDGFLASRDEDAVYAAYEHQFNDVLGDSTSLFNRMTAYDARTMLQSLLHVEDRMSMAVSLESRLPLLDHRIAELMFAMPPLYKYRDGKAKAALVNAAGSFLPESVKRRKDKMGFPVPLDRWAQGPLRELIRETLLGDAARSRGIYREAGIERLLDEGATFGRELWGLLCLETWFQLFIDGGAPPTAP